MKAVMISIRPEWCEKIASGEKTVELRKTRPKLETPFKAYIYCTKGKFEPHEHLRNNLHYSDSTIKVCEGRGKVIGEFVCDRIDYWNHHIHEVDTISLERASELSLVSENDLVKYADLSYFYAWRISDLVIYEKPKRLSEFYREGDCDCMNCRKCAWFDAGNGYNVEADCNLAYKGIRDKKTYKPIIKPPQSWCYIEEVTP